MSSKKKGFLEKSFPKLHQQLEESKEIEKQKYYFNAEAVSLTKDEYDTFMADDNIKLKVDSKEPICFDIWGNSYSEWTIRNAFNLYGLIPRPLAAKDDKKIHHDTPTACGGEIHYIQKRKEAARSKQFC